MIVGSIKPDYTAVCRRTEAPHAVRRLAIPEREPAAALVKASNVVPEGYTLLHVVKAGTDDIVTPSTISS